MKKGSVLILFIITIIFITVTILLSPSVADFLLEVISRPNIPIGGDNIRVIPGQRCVFLVSVRDETMGQIFGGEVIISILSQDVNLSVFPSRISPGEVAELEYIADNSSVGKRLKISIWGERGKYKHNQTVYIDVIEGEDGLNEQATEILGYFVPWLSLNRSELGITNETEMICTIVNPNILVVMHYIFYSSEWEIYEVWHVTVPEHAWARIFLRRRFIEVKPSYAFEISSYLNPGVPYEIEVPDWV